MIVLLGGSDTSQVLSQNPLTSVYHSPHQQRQGVRPVANMGDGKGHPVPHPKFLHYGGQVL